MGWVISLNFWPLYSSEKSLGCPLNRRLCGPQRRSGWFEEKKSSLVSSGHCRCLSVTVTEIFLRFIPESVRWLLARQKNSRAGKIVKKAARVNGVILSDRLLSGFEGAKTEHREVSLCVECCWNWDVQRGHWDGRDMGCGLCPIIVERPHLDCRMYGTRTVAALERRNYHHRKMLEDFSSSFVLGRTARQRETWTDKQTEERTDRRKERV